MEYRYSLGKYLDTTNLVTDGVFVNPCGVNWTCGAGWAIGAGIAAHAGAVSGFLSQTGVFQPGGEYTLKFDCITNAQRIIRAYIGDWSIDELVQEPLVLTSYQFDNLINLSTSDHLVFSVWTSAVGPPGPLSLDNVEVYEWFWNDPIVVEPGQWDDSSIILEESTILQSLVTNFVNNLKFIKDGYDYLLTEADNFGDKVPILIENYNNTTNKWEELYEGSINISELKIDPEKEEIIADVEQAGLGNYLRTQVDDNIFMQNNYLPAPPTFIFYRSINPGITDRPFWDFVTFHDMAGNNTIATTVGQQLRYLEECVVQSSVMTIKPESNLLSNPLYNDGVDIWLGIIRGDMIYSGPGANDYIFISTAKYLENYNYILNLGYTYGRDANNIPVLTVEDLATIIDRIPTYTFNNVKLRPYQMSFETEPKRIGTGYPNTFEGIYEEFQFVSSVPALINTLDVKPSFARNENIFNDLRTIAGAGNATYNATTLFVEYYDDLGTWRTRQTFTGGAFRYNQNILGNVYMDVWTSQLGTQYTGAGLPLINPLVRMFEFTAPITKAQFDGIRERPFEYVGFNGFGINTQGLVKRLEYPLKNTANGDAIATFKILAE